MALNDFLKYQAQTNPHPIGLDVAKAEGIYIWDTAGKKYYDLVAGLAVNNVGHRHPKVVEAIQQQLNAYLHVMPYGEFVQGPQVQLAKKLAQALPQNLDSCYFVNSGAEAIEGALKLAKRFTGRTKIVSCHKSYHGSTHGALSVTGNVTKQDAFRPLLEGISFIHFNKVEDLDTITQETAAVIVETVQGDAGVRIPTPDYMKALRQKCDETGALLILDEIQSGFGRTGTLFAFEHFGITPDILCMAKAMAAGMPMGCFVSSQEIMHSLSHSPMLGHITTFGGHPVSCAAAVANLEVLQEDVLRDVEAKGALFAEKLQHSIVKEIRQIGLMLAIDLPSQEITQQVVTKCLERGIITFWFLSNPASFRLAPPLTITFQEVEQACKIIQEVFEEVS
ncbi:MAG TPA: aspartate aminotransferase family protein [Microscillaceae bacterium]|nr:aspartate aminotransferase family protein [Microscillaceae bacterium]